jgi:hypothetical protein
MICIVSKENRKGDLLRLKFFSKTTRIHRLFFSRASDTKSPEQLSWNKQGRPRPMVSDPGHSKSSSKLQMAVKAFPTRLLNPGLPEPKCLMGTAAVDLTGIGIDRARTWQCYTCGFHTRKFFFQIFF